MKKIMKFVLASVLCLSVSMNAFAATSITTTPGLGNIIVTDKDGNVFTDMTAEMTPAPEKRAEAEAALTTSGIETEMEIFDIVDIVLEEHAQAVLEDGGKAQVTLLVPGIKATDDVKLLHQKKDNTWEVINAISGDGTVTATFTSLSPVAILIAKYNAPDVPVKPEEPEKPETPVQPEVPAQPTDSGSEQTTSNTTASPKTADFDMYGILAVMSVCAVGLVFVNRRKEG